MVRLAAVALALATLGLAWVLAPRFLTSHAAPASSSAQPTLAADFVIPAGTTPAPDVSLIDQDGQRISFAGLRGQVVAVAFMDSHCTQLCPIQADQMAAVQNRLGKTSPLSIVVISVAPQTDTPDSVRSFAAKHGWGGHWHWLLGTQAELAAAWRAYSIDVKPIASDILHNSSVYLVDRQGYQRAIFASGIDPTLLVRDVLILASP